MSTYICGCLLTCIFTYIVSQMQNGEKDRNKYQMFKVLFATLPLTYIASVRHNVGMDYPVYKSRFVAISHGQKFDEFELLYHKLNELIAYLGGDFRWLFAITAIIFMVLVGFRIFRDSPYPVLSMFLLVATTYYFSFLNGMRQMIACAILLYSLKYVQNRNLLKYIAVVAVASGFHATSWIFIFVYFIYNIEISRKRVLIFTAGIIVFAPFIGQVINGFVELSQYDHYLTSEYADREQGYISLLIGISVVILCFVFYDNNDKTFQLYHKLQIIGVWISLLVPYVPLINRVRWMFGLPVIILIPLIISKIKDKSTQLLATYLIIVLYAIYCIYNLVVYNTNNVLPYQTIFSINY